MYCHDFCHWIGHYCQQIMHAFSFFLYALCDSIFYSCFYTHIQHCPTLHFYDIFSITGLQDFQEGIDGYRKEKELNSESYQTLKNYYQALRRFRLDKSCLPTDSDEKCLAIHKISRPLNAIDLLMRQIEVAIKEPTRPGVGLLTVAAELTTKMGALRVNICDSGVFRSSLATSLEQVMILCRCHGLPFRSFRSTLNTLRRNGGLICLAKKNNADQNKSLPRQTPK